MPAKVIATVHQLAAACKKYKGIVFTDKDKNIVNDDSNDDYNNTFEITGMTQGITKTKTMNNMTTKYSLKTKHQKIYT